MLHCYDYSTWSMYLQALLYGEAHWTLGAKDAMINKISTESASGTSRGRIFKYTCSRSEEPDMNRSIGA